MRSIQTDFVFPLSSVKPLDELLSYREYCITATRNALKKTASPRRQCSACASALEPCGDVGGLDYVRCRACESIFLKSIASPAEWARLLAEISHYRRSPRAFHSNIAQSRSDNVYLPKLEWIQSTLRLQGLWRPRLMEVVTPPSEFTSLLKSSGTFTEVKTVNEMELVKGVLSENPQEEMGGGQGNDLADVAVLLESLDRADDPALLLSEVSKRLVKGALVFVTSLVCSGFDMALLGLRNLYLYPPDRTNCFSLRGLELLLSHAGFTLLEVSTPGVLDVEIVRAHVNHGTAVPLSTFEQELLNADEETHSAFQEFLQQRRLSSFARIVGRKQP